MQVLAQTSTSCGSWPGREWSCRDRPRLASKPVAAPGSGLHWKSVLGFTRPLVSDKFSVAWPQSRSAIWQKHTDAPSTRYSPWYLHFITPHQWPVRVTQTCSDIWLDFDSNHPSSEKLKVGQSLRQVTKCCFSLKRVSTPRWRKVSMLTPKIIWWVNKLLPEPQDRNSFGYFNPIWIRVHALHSMLEWFHKFLQHVDGNYDNVQFKVFLFTKVLKSIL